MATLSSLPSIDFEVDNSAGFELSEPLDRNMFDSILPPPPPAPRPASAPTKKPSSPKKRSENKNTNNNTKLCQFAVAKRITTTKHKPKTSKPRRIFPAEKQYLGPDDGPKDTDVVSGRGGRSNHHLGNRPYWIKVLAERDAYRNSRSDIEKTAIAETIIAAVKGRFLQLEEKTNRWFILPPKVVVDKVKQALRDKYVPLWAREMDDEKKQEILKTGIYSAAIADDKVKQNKQQQQQREQEKKSKRRAAKKQKGVSSPPTTYFSTQQQQQQQHQQRFDDLQEEIEKLPSFRSNKEYPMKFTSGHSLDFDALPFPKMDPLLFSTTDTPNDPNITAVSLFPSINKKKNERINNDDDDDDDHITPMLFDSLDGPSSHSLPAPMRAEIDAMLFDVLLPPIPADLTNTAPTSAPNKNKTDWNSMFSGAFV